MTMRESYEVNEMRKAKKSDPPVRRSRRTSRDGYLDMKAFGLVNLSRGRIVKRDKASGLMVIPLW